MSQVNEDSGHNLRDATLLQDDAEIMERYQRKLIEEFLNFFLGKEDPLFKLLSTTREKLIDDFFNSRK